ncbi:hypothetical protein DRJ17_03665 [Candidatus Woesearchaeota archaeon]|nr:MAG: hypothetical protein DRJ17_03665 [Candidatus Woesearchaeota archaeon]
MNRKIVILGIIALLFLIFTVAQALAGENIYGYITNSSGGGVSNVNVSIYNSTWVNLGWNLTNASGFYNMSIDVPFSGVYNYYLNTTLVGYDNKTGTLVITDETDKQFSTTLNTAPQGNITGQVTNASNSNPISNVNILIQGPITYTTTTDTNGYYSINVTTGNYNLTASKTGFIENVSDIFSVGTNFTVVNLKLALAPTTGVVQGYVVNQTGATISGVTVMLKTSDGTGTINTTTSNASGAYNFTYTGGNYQLNIAEANYYENTTSITITNGQILNQNITLTEIGTIQGTVRSSGGSALSGVTISANGPVFNNTLTDANGTYSLILPIGTYTIRAAKSGYDASTTSATITHGVTTTLNFMLSPSDGGSGGGGGGGSFSEYYPIQPVATQTSETEGIISLDLSAVKRYDFTLGANQKLEFTIKGDAHSISIAELFSDGVTLVFSSEPQSITIKQGESARVDLNRDGITDIIATVKMVRTSSIDLIIKLINEDKYVPIDSISTIDDGQFNDSQVQVVEPTNDNKTSGDNKEIIITSEKNNLRYLVYAIILIIISLIVFLARNLLKPVPVENRSKKRMKTKTSKTRKK